VPVGLSLAEHEGERIVDPRPPTGLVLSTRGTLEPGLTNGSEIFHGHGVRPQTARDPLQSRQRKVTAANPGDNRLQGQHPRYSNEQDSMYPIPPGSAIGVNLGGTKIHAAVVSPEGVAISEHRLPTDVGGQPTKVVEDIVHALCDELDADLSVIDAVGVGLGGQIDPATGDCWPAIAERAVEAVVQASAIPAHTDGLEVRRSELAGNAGVIGSASMALERVVSGLNQL